MVHKILRKLGRLIRRNSRPNRKVVTLNPKVKPKGSVLLSYIIDPFLAASADEISYAHTHYWESYQIAQTFLNNGYSVDVISYENHVFKPTKEYDYFISARTNFDRLAYNLNSNCIKVAHLDTAHWVFNNTAAYKRLINVQKRRGVTLDNIRVVEKNWAIENADLAIVLGNQFTMDTYAYSNKPIYRIPISSPQLYPWDENKDFGVCRNNYIWFGSDGFIHKGLDLVLDAFSSMPDFHLTVCGPLDKEKNFVKVYNKELFEMPNIHTEGWVDTASDNYRNILHNSVGLIYPTCAEGGGGSVLPCMHGGLIPIVSYEASVDVDDFGIVLKNCSIPEIQNTIKQVSQLSNNELQQRSNRAWQAARKTHTRESFSNEYEKFVTEILFQWQK